MKLLNPKFSLDEFWKSLKISSQSILMLDYDGTLSPFTPDRDHANPYEGVIDRLDILLNSNHTRVIIVSGRSITAIEKLLKTNKALEIYGCHGAEYFHPSHGYKLITNEKSKEFLNNVIEWVNSNNFKKITEIKPVSVAFHWRGLSFSDSHKLREQLEKQWFQAVSKYGFELHHFDGGIELRPSDINKGTVVQTILAQVENSIPIAYLGDDLTDEDAFKEVGNNGLSVLVKEKKRSTKADLQLIPPTELLDFFDKWIQCTS